MVWVQLKSVGCTCLMSNFDSWDLEIVNEKNAEPLLNQSTRSHYASKSYRSSQENEVPVCWSVYVCVCVVSRHACKGGGCWKWVLRIFSVHLPFSCPLRKPHLSIHPSVLTQLKHCCQFAVSLPWFPLCFLPALVWRTKRWWWVVLRERERQRCKTVKDMLLFFCPWLFNIMSLTQTHTYRECGLRSASLGFQGR